MQIGVQVANEIAAVDAQEFDRFLRVNVTGTMLVTRDISAAMKTQAALPVDLASPNRGTTRGAIVNMGSAQSLVAWPGMVQYTASKFAVLGISKNAGKFVLLFFHFLSCFIFTRSST